MGRVVIPGERAHLVGTDRLRLGVARWTMWARGVDVIPALTRARERERFTPAQLEAHQRASFAKLVRIHAHNAAYHGALKEARGTSAPRMSSARIEDHPPMDKATLASVSMASHSERFLTRLCSIGKTTSGSTGRPLVVWKQASGLAEEIAVTWRAYGWYGVAFGDRQLRIWGRPLSGHRRLLQRLKNGLLNARTLSAFDVDDGELDRQLEEIRREKPRLIYGYASALQWLGERASVRESGPFNGLQAIVSTAEPLAAIARDTIREGFGVSCRDEYGCSEVGSIAHECTHGRLHVMADNLIPEVERPDGSIRSEGDGELLLTDLTNHLTPVVRYRVGDFCQLEPASSCSCGLPFPVIREIGGRVEDTIFLAGGRRTHPALICYLVDAANRDLEAIRQYQVTQQSMERFLVRYVGSEASRHALEKNLEARFRDRLGLSVQVDVELVERIERTPGGKFRLVRGMTSTH